MSHDVFISHSTDDKLVESTPPPIPPSPSHLEIPPPASAKVNAPEESQPPSRDVPPPIIPGVLPLPLSRQLPPVPPAGRKKIIQRVFIGLIGISAIGYGTLQLARGLHLLSTSSSSVKATSPSHQETIQEINKTLASLQSSRSPDAAATSPSAPGADDLEATFVQGCYINYPKGWQQKENSPISTMFIAPKSRGFSANLVITTDQFPGTLRQYVEATMTALKVSSPALRVMSDAAFPSARTTPGAYKVALQNKFKDVDFAQNIYFFDGAPGTKVAITSSAPNAQAATLDPLFDRCAAKVVTGAIAQ